MADSTVSENAAGETDVVEESDVVDGTKQKRSTSLASQQDNSDISPDEDTEQRAVLRKALDNLEAGELQELAKKELWTAHTVVVPQKFRNPLHVLVVSFASQAENAVPSEMGELNRKFQDCLEVLIENGVDLNEGDISRNTALHLLAQHCGVDAAIQALVDAGAVVDKKNSNDQTPLHLACEEATAKEVEVLLKAGADPNLLDSSCLAPLHYAVKYRRNLGLIKHLLDYKASVDIQNVGIRNRGLGPAPLHVAIRSNRKENVKILLEHDANPDIQDSSGQTPLHLAASYDVTGSIARMLLLKSASVNKVDFVYGETPIHKAIRRNMVHNVRALCQSEDTVLTIPDIHGQSALHRAAISCRDMGIWTALLSVKQADIRTRNDKAQTPLERATRSSNKLAVSVLKQAEG